VFGPTQENQTTSALPQQLDAPQLDAPQLSPSPGVSEVIVKGDNDTGTDKVTGAGALKDDKGVGAVDHVGYSEYAMHIAQLINAGLEPPVVFGICALWGTGKSFLLEKVKTAMMALQIEEILIRDHRLEEEGGRSDAAGLIKQLVKKQGGADSIDF
jgi:hypothetical protein